MYDRICIQSYRVNVRVNVGIGRLKLRDAGGGGGAGKMMTECIGMQQGSASPACTLSIMMPHQSILSS